MAFRQLIVEDGTGLKNANTYCSLSYSISYFSMQQNTTWLELDAQQQELYLIQAANLLDDKYGQYYKGNLLTNTQSLLFPRTKFVDNNGREVTGIPKSLKNAQCEMAFLAISGAAQNDPNAGVNNLKSYTDKVDVIEESKEYFSPMQSTTYNSVIRAMAPLMTYSSYQTFAVRG